MSFRCTLRSLFVALVGISAVAAVHAQQFAQPTVVPYRSSQYAPEPTWATTILHGDMDGDGKEDLIYRFNGQGLYATGSYDGVFFNNGSGTFTGTIYSRDYDPQLNPIQTIAALDPGGHMVLLSLQSLGAVTRGGYIGEFFYGPSRHAEYTEFSSTSFHFVASNPPVFTELLAADVNGDGAKDLLVEDSANNSLYVLLNAGSGQFTMNAQYSLPAADGTGPIAIGDFNGDGKIDILINNQTSHVITPYYGHGDGTFTVGTPYTLPGGIFSMLVQDIDGDGISDLVVEGANGALSYFQGASTGFPVTAMPLSGAEDGRTGNGGHLIGVADLNGDGVPDILTSTPIGISVLLGRPPLNSHTPYIPVFTLKGIYNAGPGRSSYALADFNGDGHLDLAVDSPEGIAIIFGAADGSFQTSRAYAAGAPALSGALGVFTASGKVDAVVATADVTAQFLQGNGDGTFAYRGSPGAPVPTGTLAATPGLWSVVQTGDFDGDGKLDLALTADGSDAAIPGFGNGLRIQHGLGDGTFTAPARPGVTINNPCSPPRLLWGTSTIADFDGQGLAEIANRDRGALRVSHGLNQSGPDVNEVFIRDTDCNHVHDIVISGKFTGGALPDLISQSGGSLLLYPNDGAGSFLLAAGDLSVDGSLTTAGQRTAPVLSSSFGGTVDVSSGGLGFPAFIGSAAVADLDGDGKQDLIVSYDNMAADHTAPKASSPNYIYFWYGSGSGKFLTSAKHPVNPVRVTPSRNFYQVASADLNNDGVADLILSDGYIVSVQYGKGDGTFGPETHSLAGQGINTISIGDVNGDHIPDLVLANGGAVLSNPSVNHETLASNAEVNTGGITVLLAPTPAVTTVLTGTLAADPPSVGSAQTFTLTATLVSTSNVAATGTVDFSVDGALVGTGAVTNNVATYMVSSPAYAVGTHALTAVYSGDANYGPLTLTGSLTVTLLPTETFMDNIVTPIHYGEIIGDIAQGYADFTGSAVGSDSQLLDGGDLDFYIDGQVVCTLVYMSGQSQRCPATTGAGYSVGTYTLTSGYLGNQYAASSHSPDYTVVVLADDTTGILTSSANPAAARTMVTFTATFSSAFATPAGTVTFYDGTTPIGTGTLNANGAAPFGTSTLSIGFHDISASLAASNNFNGSTTTVLRQEIDSLPLATTTLLSSNPNPSLVGQGVTFTAVVASGSSVPQGTLTFTIDGLPVSTGTLNGQGVATFTSSVLGVGSHTVVASYAGTAPSTSAYFSASRSATLVQVVNVLPPPGDFTLTVTPNPITVQLGRSRVVTVAVAALNGFSQAVALSCGNLPSEVTCAFDTDTIAAGGGSTRLTVYVSGPHSCNVSGPFYTSSGPTSWLGLLGACGLLLLVKRRRVVVLGIALCVLSAISGCGGNCTDLGVKPGRYSFTVTGTSAGTPSVTKTVTVPMVADL